MIRQDIYLEREDWHIVLFYAVTHFAVSEIMQTLEDAGCRGRNLESAYQNLSSGNLNTGLCFSGKGVSVLVISVTSSKPQFLNSLVHESHHLSTQIGSTLGYDLLGEDVCYLSGMIAGKMYPVVSQFLCECCSNKTRRLWRR